MFLKYMNGPLEKFADSFSKLSHIFRKQIPRKFIPPKIVHARISFLRLFRSVMV